MLRSLLRIRPLLFGWIACAWISLAVPRAGAEPADYDEARDEPNSLHAGDTSLELLTFGGGTNGIYLKHQFWARSAVRLGATFYWNDQSGDSPPGQLVQVDDNTDWSYTISAELIGYADATGPVTAFFGLGPIYSRRHFKYERSRTYTAPPFIPSYSYQKYDDRAWTAGGLASAGFEWFFRRNLSVVGRVSASVGFGKSHTKEMSRYVDGAGTVLEDTNLRFDSTTASASTGSAGLGLGLHF